MMMMGIGTPNSHNSIPRPINSPSRRFWRVISEHASITPRISECSAAHFCSSRISPRIVGSPLNELHG